MDDAKGNRLDFLPSWMKEFIYKFYKKASEPIKLSLDYEPGAPPTARRKTEKEELESDPFAEQLEADITYGTSGTAAFPSEVIDIQEAEKWRRIFYDIQRRYR